MADPVDSERQRAAAEALWEGLATLQGTTTEERALPCVRLATSTGAEFDVYRAERIERHVVVWKVRGFYRDADGETTEQRAVVMGTRDGRAMLTHPASDPPRPSEMIVDAEQTLRNLADLADVIAAAVRRLVQSSDVD
jgi:hypothetical protein